MLPACHSEKVWNNVPWKTKNRLGFGISFEGRLNFTVQNSLSTVLCRSFRDEVRGVGVKRRAFGGQHSRSLGSLHYLDSIYCITWTRNVIPFTVKRDSENIIDYKTRRVTWFLNNAWFKTRFFVWHKPVTTRATACTWQWMNERVLIATKKFSVVHSDRTNHAYLNLIT